MIMMIMTVLLNDEKKKDRDKYLNVMICSKS